jgi:2-polyprenyl-3-methyl-5-hydroxy-6-metoxy-1,4-benzoquinol methylase
MTAGCALCDALTLPLFEKAGREYRRCTQCGLVSAAASSQNANFPDSIEHYEPAYRQYLDEDHGDAGREDHVIAWIERYANLARPDARLLDVGAGSGKLLRRLRKTRQCRVSGIEPSMPLFREYQLADLGIAAVTLPELAAQEPEGFDVITALDVIEHVPSAREFVGALSALTKPGGFVFVSTPDASGVLARLLGRFWHHFNAYHYVLYDARTLAHAARTAGFVTVESGHRGRRMSLSYLWNYAGDFLLRRRRTTPFRARGSDRWAINVNLNDVISVVWQKAA